VVSPPATTRQPHAPRTGRLARGRVRTLIAADLVAIAVALAGTYLLAELIGPPAVIAPGAVMAVLIVAAAVAWIAIFAAYRLYEGETRAIAPASFDEVGSLLHALLAGSLLLLVTGQGLKRLAGWAVYSPLEALIFLALALVAIPVLRGAVRTWVLPAVMRPRRTLVVGAGHAGRLVERKIAAHPEYGLRLVGFVDDHATLDDSVLGRTADLTELVDRLDIDWVILSSTSRSCRATSSCSRRTRRSRTSRACRS
jgi:FlaA1/EpsC-like NDP-sugar epimerase